MDLKIGQTVETANRRGVVRFVGEVTNMNGYWVGLQLPSPTGKNDGTVRGERYFDCPPQHGIFVKIDDVLRIVSQPPPPSRATSSKPAAKPAATRPAAPAAKGRPSSIGAARPAPSPSPRPASRPSSTVGSKPTTQTRPLGGLKAAGSRLSIKPGQAPQASTAASGGRASAQSDAQQQTRTAPLGGPKAPSQTLAASKRQSIAGSSQAPTTLRSTRKPSVSASSTTASSRPAPSATSSASATRATASKDPRLGALETENNVLKEKVTHMQEELSSNKNAKIERDRFETIIQKLQAKCQANHQELTETKALIKEKDAEIEALSRAAEEHDLDLENAAIDRETAELRLEQAENERERLRDQLENLRLDNDILREEAQLFQEDLSPEDRQAAASLVVSKENNRLKEALVRMKEIFDDEIRKRDSNIRELESSLNTAEARGAESDSLRERLEETTATLEDFRQRLEAAEEWEEIVEDLSEQNQQLKERAVEKDAAIDHYATMKELSDEVEAQLMERVNDLQAESELKELEIADLVRRQSEDAAAIEEQDLLVAKYREVLAEMQSNVSSVEAQKTLDEEQMKSMTGRFNELMDMNRRMHTARLNDTNKAINTELTRISAEEAREELSIMKQYLPGSSAEYMSDSLRAYFLARKVDSKAAIASTHMTLADMSSIEGAEQALANVYRYEAAHDLDIIGYYGKLFWKAVEHCSLDDFRSIHPAYKVLSDIETTIDNTLERVRNDELNFKEIAQAVRKPSSSMQGLTGSPTDMFESRPDLQIICYVSSMRSSIEWIRTSFKEAKSFILEIADADCETARNLAFSISATEECVVGSTKLLQVLETLQSDGLYPVYPDGIEDMRDKNLQLGMYAKSVSDFALALINALPATADPDHIADATSNILEEVSLDPINPLRAFKAGFAQWHEYASVLMNTAEIELQPAPWVLKAEQMENARKGMLDAEKRLQQLTTEHQSLLIQIREREEVIDTKELEIEHLRAKHRDVSTRASSVERLQQELEKASTELQKLRQKVDEQRQEISRLEDKAIYSPMPEASVAPESALDRAPEPAGDAKPSKVVPPSNFITFVEALTEENEWLRRREQAEMYGHSLKAVFLKNREIQAARTKADSRHKQARAAEMLDMSLSMDFGTPSTPSTSVVQDGSFLKDDWTPDMKSTSIPRGLTQVSAPSPSRRPVLLAPIQTSLKQPVATTPVTRDSSFAHLEDFSFVDLSPIADVFSLEMTQTLEEFSEIM